MGEWLVLHAPSGQVLSNTLWSIFRRQNKKYVSQGSEQIT